MREDIDVKQECQKNYDRSRYGPSYKAGKELLVFIPTVKQEKQENLILSVEDHT